jgi:hypothetical protein
MVTSSTQFGALCVVERAAAFCRKSSHELSGGLDLSGTMLCRGNECPTASCACVRDVAPSKNTNATMRESM